MNILRVPDAPVRAGYGPRPGASTGAGLPPMSRSRTALFERLRAQTEPATIGALVAATGLHQNTIREHLSALEEMGLVRRQRASPHGRGRPAWLYASKDSSHGSAYAGLATALAAAVHRSSRSPAADAVEVGREWGRGLAQEKGGPAHSGSRAAREHVVALLGDVGFGPESDTRFTVVRLTQCPLLEAAYRDPEVICGVHLGIVKGALEEYGADPSRAELRAFAEPGACRLDLMARRSPETA